MNTTQRGAATRRRILEAAASLTVKNGVNGTSVDDVLKASATGKSQFYHYFASKDALVKELISHHLENSLGLKALALEGPLDSIDDFGAWLARLVQAQADGLFDDGCPIGNLAAELSAQNETVRVELQKVILGWREALAGGFEALKGKGLLRADVEPARLATFVVSCLEGALLLAKTERTAEPLVASAAELLAHVQAKAPKPVRQGAMAKAPAPAKADASRKYPHPRGHLTFCP